MLKGALWRRISVSILSACCVFALALAFGLWGSGISALKVSAERYVVTSTISAISPGVEETKYITNDSSSNSDQVVMYGVTVDLSQNQIIAGYKDYDASTWGMQTVREQAAAAERSPALGGRKVVAAINADFYNMGTGQPIGALVMGGVKYNDSPNGRDYFAILKDGTPVIRTGALQGDEMEAVGGATRFIIDGEVNPNISSTYDTTKGPRSTIGITADRNIMIMMVDGRQAPYSSGCDLFDLAAIMIENGCVDAVQLDGGGSATYLAKYAGTDELTLANSPSDGQERSVSSSLLVVSNAEPTGVFDSAVISPTNEVYTPGSVVNFTAIGADTAGYGVSIPEGAMWRVAENSEVDGVITGVPAESGVQAAAKFEADEGAVGTATIEMVYQDEVVGTATIELQWPDALTMENSRFSLDFSEETDFGIAAYWQTREVHLKSGDLEWEIGDTGNEQYPSIGQMNGDIFVADAEATNVTATVTAKLVHNTSVTVSAEVSVGQLPHVLWDFEDITDENGDVIQTAEDYYINSGEFKVSTSNTSTKATANIVDTSNGEVRIGQKALQINYDFTQSPTGTSGVYFGASSYFEMPNDFGMPTAFGVWIYVPTDGFNFWLRTWFQGCDEEGNNIPGNSFSSGFGGNFTNGQALEQGWNYIYVDFTEANSFGAAYYRFGSQMFRIMLVDSSSMGTHTSGYIYLDNFQFEYGPNTDDIFAPEINSVTLNNESGLALEDGMTISDDPFSIYASYEEFMGLSDEELAEIEDESLRDRYEKASLYATGVNEQNVHVYVDGNEVKLNNQTETYLSTATISLPNGKHIITVEVYDNFQNVVTKSYTINVANESEYAAVLLTPETEIPYLGSPYVLDLSADKLDGIQKVTFEIRLASGLSLKIGDITDIAAGFKVTACDLVHVNNNIYSVTIERDDSAEVASGQTLLAKLNINIPITLIEGSQLSYSVVSSEVTYDDPDFQSEVINSFYDGNVGVEVQSYYTITNDTMVVGSEGGYIYVTDPEGEPAAGVTVTVDGTSIGVTNEDGRIYTDTFIKEACEKIVAAQSGLGYSFGQTVYGVLPGGTEGKADPTLVRAVATTNGNTEQRIVWLSNPLYAESAASVKYATVADFKAKGEAAFKTVAGDCLFVEFTGTYAVNVNQVLITGLAEDTEYVYRAGDGKVWSENKNFSTSKQHGETNFFVIGDTQEDNPAAIEAYAKAINGSGIDYDFAIQTGDFVDNGGSYALWKNIISLFGDLSSTDFVQVFGNHEYEGSSGEYPTAMNFVPNQDYYSVTYGNVYVAVINIYTESGLNAAMEWIKADAAKSDAVWKVLTMHRPPYYTNISGGSETAHALIPAFVDEVGFDVVFSGHDHSYARTLPMTGGEVDNENGAVYFIVGAAESGRYGITDNPEFHFAKVSGDFNAIYFSVSASYTEMKITVYNMLADGSGFEVFDDTYTITNSCYPDEHEYVYDRDAGILVCTNCYYEADPVAVGLNGFIKTTDGQTMFFTAGVAQKGWIPLGEEYYYFDEDGIGVNGELTLTSDYAGQEAGDITFVFENGLKVGGYTGWYGEKYYEQGTFVTGWIDLDGVYYYLATGNDLNNPGVEEIGDKLTGYKYCYTPMGDYFAVYYIHFDEEGRYVRGDFHLRGDQIHWSYTDVRPTTDGSSWIYYVTDQWIEIDGSWYYANAGENIATGLFTVDGILYEFNYVTDDNGKTGKPDVTGHGRCLGAYTGLYNGKYYFEGIIANGWFEDGGDTFYAENGNLVTGDKVIDGVKYRFGNTEADNGVLLGRYYKVQFISQASVISSVEIFQGDVITAPANPEPPTDNSIKSYTFVGWFNGDKQLNGDLATQDIIYTAKFDATLTKKYYEIEDALEVLDGAETFAEKRAALAGIKALYDTLTSVEIADCEAKGLSFDLYQQLSSQLYTINFAINGEVIHTISALSGETVDAPTDPEVPAGNSIKSYTFAGWFNGDVQFVPGTAAHGGTYTAKYETVYTQKYNETAAALNALQAAETLAEKRAALVGVQALYETLSAAEIADCEAEGLNFESYKELLSQLYTVQFTVNGEAVQTVSVLSGETVTAPAAPAAPVGNSIKSYTFEGWFSGDTAYSSELVIKSNTTFEARFEEAYTEKYEQLSAALAALDAAKDGTLAARYEALTAVYDAREEMGETELRDAEAEGLSFTLYEEMLSAYNSVASGAKEDLDTASNAAAMIVGIVTAVAAAAAVTGFCIKRR